MKTGVKGVGRSKMWISRKRLEELEKRLGVLECKSADRFQMAINLLGELKNSIDNKVEKSIGIKVVQCAKDEIAVELFNKLKDNLSRGKE